MKFSTSSPAKYIVSGEHAVTRGGEALVFPLNNFNMYFNYIENQKDLRVHVSGINPDVVSVLCYGLINKALKSLHLKNYSVKGEIHIKNEIPMGVGLGFSAAFCSVISQFFIWRGLVDSADFFSFTRLLENNFHGRSSGVDIAGVNAKTGILYKTTGVYHNLNIRWRPNFSLYYLGRPGITLDSVRKVNEYYDKNQGDCEKIDKDMAKSVNLATKSLTATTDNLKMLSLAIKLAQSCFVRWGLVSDEDSAKIKAIYNKGAIAVKCTGAGNGGYLLVLWEQLQQNNDDNMIDIL